VLLAKIDDAKQDEKHGDTSTQNLYFVTLDPFCGTSRYETEAYIYGVIVNSEKGDSVILHALNNPCPEDNHLSLPLHAKISSVNRVCLPAITKLARRSPSSTARLNYGLYDCRAHQKDKRSR
jgi:hypothetical protein